MTIDADTARRSTAPGDVIITKTGRVTRVVEHRGEEGYLALTHQTGAAGKLNTISWDRANEYYHRDDVDDPLALRDQDGGDK